MSLVNQCLERGSLVEEGLQDGEGVSEQAASIIFSILDEGERLRVKEKPVQRLR